MASVQASFPSLLCLHWRFLWHPRFFWGDSVTHSKDQDQKPVWAAGHSSPLRPPGPGKTVTWMHSDDQSSQQQPQPLPEAPSSLSAALPPCLLLFGGGTWTGLFRGGPCQQWLDRGPASGRSPVPASCEQAQPAASSPVLAQAPQPRAPSTPGCLLLPGSTDTEVWVGNLEIAIRSHFTGRSSK